MKNIARFLACAFLAIAATAGGAAAQTVSALSAAELEKVLADAGFSPQAIQDEKVEHPMFGGTVVLAENNKITFFVRTTDCTGDPEVCANMIFYANFDLGRDVALEDFRILNHFNDVQVFGRAYALEQSKQVGVDYRVHLGGGVASEHVTQAFARWPDVIQRFIDGFRSGAPK